MSADSFDPTYFELVLSQIKDGTLFERFAQDLLCQVLSFSFTPIGGIHDRAIDGLERCHFQNATLQTIYQMSIESDSRAKIKKTLDSLKGNAIPCARFVYVTNRKVESQDLLEEEFYNSHGIIVKCRDVTWLRGHVQTSEGTMRTYLTFMETYSHQFSKPLPIVLDFGSDPRLFVFLSQQWESANANARLDEVLLDSLILFALEGTDPATGRFMTKEDILAKISQTGLSTITGTALERRLNFLSKKPRKINCHEKEKKYCLPYTTRIELEQKYLFDKTLHSKFEESSDKRLKEELKNTGVRVADAQVLLLDVINKIFKDQGLEFANFVTQSASSIGVDKSLDDIISKTVDKSVVIPKNRQKVKTALLASIRGLLYNGTIEETQFLKRLANTYMVLFLLQCDPKIATYFSMMAGELRILVDNSILVPAISEINLDPPHRRYWNLLSHANKSGVRLLAHRATIKELVSHIRKALKRYKEDYQGQDECYTDHTSISIVSEILIRAFFYTRIGDRSLTFLSFIDQFVTPGGSRMEAELIQWLHDKFGIALLEDNLLAPSDDADLRRLSQQLVPYKGSAHQSETDARTILSVYKLRERDNEASKTGIFGYKTWWLSIDTSTQKAVDECFGKGHRPGCYMRPDFLYHYICLAPTQQEVNRVFDVMFPSLLGVNISHHLPEDLCRSIHARLKEHSKHDPARVRAKLGTLIDRLQTEGSLRRDQLYTIKNWSF